MALSCEASPVVISPWEDFYRNRASSANWKGCVTAKRDYCNIWSQTRPDQKNVLRQEQRQKDSSNIFSLLRLLLNGQLDAGLRRSQQRGALFNSVTLTGTSGSSGWETTSYELHKDKLLMWKLVTLIFVKESQKCLGGAPLWV